MNYDFQSPYQIGPRTWGLYSKYSTVAIPLQSLDISVTIIHNVARVFYTQHYHNASQAALDTEFFFPISPDACFDSFQAKLGDKVITGVVRHKQQAQQQYTQAVQQGRTAAYSEINPDAGDVMKVLIGNIAPQSAIHITYSYVEQLTPSLGKFWCFRLFSCITPRYCGSLMDLLSSDVGLLSSYPTVSSEKEGAYPWKIQVQIQSPSGLTAVRSPSHDIISEFGNEHHTCTVALSRYYVPNKDFVLLFACGDKIDYISSVMTPFEDGYCAMISMMADFDDKTSPEQAYDNFVKAKPVNEQHHSTSQIRGEYIFLLDRSGSMSGKRMDMAKSSLALFLKSLPKDSLFNVVSFGSNYSFMHSSSIKASQQSIDAACRLIESFTADMGGTEIYPCLSKVFADALRPGYPRFVFLMTDGDVTNTRQVLDLIKTHNHAANVFSVGIGSGCSVELITKSAFYGKGKYELVVDTAEIHEKVISLLKAALSPCLSDFSLHADNFDAMVKNVSPIPQTVSSLLAGQMATFFVLLRKEGFDITTHKMAMNLKVYDSKLQGYRTVQVSLDEREVIDNEMIAKLAVHSMIDAHDSSRLEKNDKSQALLWLQKEEMENVLLSLSVKYGVLCKQTAFICEVKEQGKVDMQSVEKIKVVVPSVSSADYGSNIDLFSNACMDGFNVGGDSYFVDFNMPPPQVQYQQQRQEQKQYQPKHISCTKYGTSSNYNDNSSQNSFGASSNTNQNAQLDFFNMGFSGPAPSNPSCYNGFDSVQANVNGFESVFNSFGLTNQNSLSANSQVNRQCQELSDLTGSNSRFNGLPTNNQLSKPVNDQKFGGFGDFDEPRESVDLYKKKEPSRYNMDDDLLSNDFNLPSGNFGLFSNSNTSTSINQASAQTNPSTFETWEAFSKPSAQNNPGFAISRSTEPSFESLFGASSFNGPQCKMPSSNNTHSYLDVALLQTFEGCWSPTDNKLLSVLLYSSILPQAPPQLKPTSTVPINTIWVTLLVLVWLEKACKKDQKSWSLIHQKGCEWLKEQGIDYETMKSLGDGYVRV